MHDSFDDRLRRLWHPVARAEEVEKRHIVQAQLLGQEVAVWRADSGQVNAWENRCPHRGTRLSIGENTGAEVKCRYHGWRFASGSGQCTFLPAHPEQTPSKVMHAVLYGCREKYGYVWVNLAADAGEPECAALEGTAATTLRSVFVNAPTSAVSEALQGYGRIVAADGLTVQSIVEADERKEELVFLLQPVTVGATIIHGALQPQLAGGERLAALRRLNERLTALRDAVEAVTLVSPSPPAGRRGSG